jgi:hypothetical protein
MYLNELFFDLRLEILLRYLLNGRGQVKWYFAHCGYQRLLDKVHSAFVAKITCGFLRCRQQSYRKPVIGELATSIMNLLQKLFIT